MRQSTYSQTLIIADTAFFSSFEADRIGEMEGELEKSESLIWDCGSSLYDSLELASFQRQLHSAMASRSLSMSSFIRCTHHDTHPQPKRFSHISRSFRKLVRSLFKPKPGSESPPEKPTKGGRMYFLRDGVDNVSTILEAPHLGYFPELSSFPRRTASARFSATSIGIS